MESDKAEIFSQTWATVGPELVEKLKHNIFSPKKVKPHIIENLTVFMKQLSFSFFVVDTRTRGRSCRGQNKPSDLSNHQQHVASVVTSKFDE